MTNENTKPYTLILGDCLDKMKELPESSVDSIVTDPPYELGFMGKTWDSTGIAYSVAMWKEALRVLKPGGHLLAFGGSRTYHRMTCAIEDAGFEIRDQIMWIYGSGFPKSLDVSKAIDKAAGAERTVIGQGRGRTGAAAQPNGGSLHSDDSYQWPGNFDISTATTDAAKQWSGWGTALKPAHEPICVARKPLEETVARNVLRHGTGAINIDGCRVAVDPIADASQLRTMNRNQRTDDTAGQEWGMSKNGGDEPTVVRADGRWPANLIHDGSEEVVSTFPDAKGQQGDLDHQDHAVPAGNAFGQYGPKLAHKARIETDKSAARFFYCAKTPKKERGEGNNHPTVKPLALMRYLCRLVTQKNGAILDPFTGSGSTGIAAIQEGFQFIGIEKDEAYLPIATKRISEAFAARAPVLP